MMDYKSPIEIAIGQFRLEQEKRIEGEVFKAIQDYGITIDKDELIKALQYDRGQYDKGYKDGCVCAIRRMHLKLLENAYKPAPYGYGKVVDVSDIEKIVKELLEEG